MRVAVIGAGTMGGMHATLLSGLPEVTELLIVEADATRATTVAEGLGARVVAHDEAFAAADAVVIATPADHHVAAVEAAVTHHVPALCEKPLTDDLESAAALVELVESSGAHVEVGFQRRHDAAFADAHRRVADGSLGPVHLLRLTAFDPRVTPRPASEWTPNDAAPIFLHSSVHDFDLVRWLTGQEVLEVTADGSRRDEARPDDPRGIETAVVTLRMSDGTLAIVESTWLHPSGYDIRAELVAERAHLTMGLSPRTPAEHLDWPATPGPEGRWTGYLQRFEAAYRSELVAFLAAVRAERQPTSSARDGLEALRIAVAATRAFRDRRPIPLTEI